MRTITVKGYAERSKAPDTAELFCTVRGEDEAYSAAYNKTEEALAALKNALCAAGNAEKDIKTGMLRMRRKTEYAAGRVLEMKGYVFEQTLSLRFPCKGDRAVKTAAAAAESGCGADFSLRFTLRDEKKLRQELMAEACGNARRQAEIIARACGEKLGGVKEICYGGDAAPAPLAARAFSQDAAVSPEEVRVSESVSIVWELG